MTNDPTAFEQALLEFINRARLDPAGAFDRVIADPATDTAVQENITSAMRYFGVDVAALRTQLAAFDPVAPLAWNEALATSSDAHSQRMIDTDTQAHRLPGEASLGDRISAAGYDGWSNVSENIYAYTEDPLQGHAGFMVDWGYDAEDLVEVVVDGATQVQLRDNWQSLGDGIQDPAGHRDTILDAKWVDIGISALEETAAGTSVGPWVMTQNFGTIHAANPAQLLGVVIDDADGDRFYDMGEGLGGIDVRATGSAGTFTTTTWASGGYQMELAPGSYTVSFSGAGLDGVASYRVTMGTQNVKQDGFAVDTTPVPAVNVQFADGIEAVYFPDVAAQVFRLYQAVLDRAPDNTGHLAWTGRIAVDGWDASAVAQGFMGSPEFQARFGGQDNAGFVGLLYNNVLGRAPDATGLARWTGDLDGGTSRAEVVLGFSDSAEFRSATAAEARAFAQGNSPSLWGDDVYRLYQATLDRAPDLTGFVNWSGRLGSGTPFLEVADGFVRSPQFKATYDTLDSSGFVTLLYNNVLGRAPDAAGLARWSGDLDGGSSRAEVVRGFSQSAEFVAASAADVAAWVQAQGIDDVITATGGENMLAGGLLSDSFVFAPLGGNSRVLDLESWDKLDLTAFGYGSDAEARGDFRQLGRDVVFDDAAGTTAIFVNTALSVITDEMILV